MRLSRSWDGNRHGLTGPTGHRRQFRTAEGTLHADAAEIIGWQLLYHVLRFLKIWLNPFLSLHISVGRVYYKIQADYDIEGSKRNSKRDQIRGRKKRGQIFSNEHFLLEGDLQYPNLVGIPC